MTTEDFEAMQQLQDEPHGFELQRLSRTTNIIDLTDRRLKEFVRSLPGNEGRKGSINSDIYACRVGRKQRQFGRTVAEAIRAAIKGAPLR